jgi:hypothetical protein
MKVYFLKIFNDEKEHAFCNLLGLENQNIHNIWSIIGSVPSWKVELIDSCVCKKNKRDNVCNNVCDNVCDGECKCLHYGPIKLEMECLELHENSQWQQLVKMYEIFYCSYDNDDNNTIKYKTDIEYTPKITLDKHDKKIYEIVFAQVYPDTYNTYLPKQ